MIQTLNFNAIRTIIKGAAAAVILLLAVIPFMGHMGQDSDILVYAKEYYVTITLSLIPFAMFFAIISLSISSSVNTRVSVAP